MTEILYNDEDMIYNIIGNKTMAGGFSINSKMLNEHHPALYNTYEVSNKSNLHSKVSDRFKHLAVPAGLFYIEDSLNRNNYNTNLLDNSDNAIINDELYEQLLTLAKPNINNTKKKRTRSKNNKIKKHKQTKRRL